MVSNGTGQRNFSGQRDRNFFLVPGQRDNGTSSKFCHGTGRDGILTACPVPSRDVPRDRNERKNIDKIEFFFYDFLFQNIFSCFGTSSSVLEHPFPVLERLFPVLERLFPVSERPFPVFLSFWEGYFVPGRDKGVCPGTFAPALVPGQRDTGTRIFFCPGTKGQRDVPSRFVPGRPAGRPVPWKP